MAGRTDKSIGFNLIGRDISASRALKSVGKNADRVGRTLSSIGKRAVQAFAVAGAAAGAYAIKVAVDGVKAAIEDEAAQARLARTLRNVTKATRSQIAAVNDYVDRTQLATGVADDQLRPSLDRLVRSTGNITKAQKLQALSLDISAGTGRDLAGVTEALAKGYDGNLGALRRIGVRLSAATIKSKDFRKAQAELTKTFQGQQGVLAQTTEGRLRRLSLAYAEIQERIGVALLEPLDRFSKFMLREGVDALDAFVGGLIGEQGVAPAISKVDDRMGVLQKDRVPTLSDSARKLGAAMNSLGTAIGRLFATDGTDSPLVKSLMTVANAVGAIENFILSNRRNLAVLNQLFRNPSTIFMDRDKAEALIDQRTNTFVDPATGRVRSGVRPRAMGGPVSGGRTYLVGERGPELLHMGRGSAGYVSPRLGSSAPTIQVIVQGSVVTEQQLTKTIRDNVAQMMRRQGANPAILGVGR